MSPKACPPCTGDCNQGRTCPAGASPAYVEHLTWHYALTEKPPVDHDVLVTFEDVRGAYIAAWMGPENGWIGVDALPVEKIAWWAALPPGPPLALTAEARRAAAPAA